MRTTLNLDAQLLTAAKFRAIEQGVSLTHVVESALRDFFAKPEETHRTVQLITASGAGVKPGIDLDNGRSLLDIMEDLS